MNGNKLKPKNPYFMFYQNSKGVYTPNLFQNAIC